MSPSIRNLLISFSLVTIAVLFIILYTFSILRSQKKVQAQIQQSREVLQTLGISNSDIQELESTRANYYGTGSAALLPHYDSTLKDLRTDSLNLSNLAGISVRDSASFHQLAGLIHQMIDYAAADIHAIQPIETGRKNKTERGMKMVKEFRQLSGKLEEENRVILNTSYAHNITLLRDIFSFVKIISVLLGLIFLVSFYFIYHDIQTRKRTEEKLKRFNDELEKQVNDKTLTIRDSEEKYRSLFESLSDAYGKVDMTGRIIEFNSAFRNMLGYTDEEIYRLSYNDITPVKWHEKENELVTREVLVKGYSEVFEKEYIHKNGTVFPVELRSFLLKNNAGEPTGMWAIVRDISERKAAEQKIKDSEENLRHVLSSTSDNFYVIDRDCAVTLINKAAERNLAKAWGKPVVVGTNILDVLPEKNTEPIKESLIKVFKGETVEYELHSSRSDLPTWVLVTYRPVLNENGAVTGAYIVAKDITEKKIADLERKESEDRYRALVENAPEALFVFDLETRKFLNVSESAVRLFKMSKEDLLHVGPMELSPEFQPDGRSSGEAIMGNIGSVLKGGKPSFEWTHCDSTGALIPCEVRLVRLPSEKHILIRGSVIDITERKAAERKLRESEERYRSIIEQASDPIMITDEKGNFIEVNSAMCKKFGYAGDELMKLNVNDLIDPTQLKNDPIDFKLLLEGHSVFRERRMMHRDGTIVEVEANVKMLPDGRMLAIARDITERKKTEKEKEYARLLLGERIKELTALYRSSQILQAEDKATDEILQEVVSILPAAWRYPEDAAARIILGDKEYRTSNFNTGMHKQSADFVTSYGEKGSVEVVYLTQKPVEDEDAFLAEERDLINLIAVMVRVYLVRMHEMAMRAQMQQQILNQKIQAQKTITRAVIKAEERERNKIGQELHDNVNQILASIKLFLSMAQGKGLMVNDEILGKATRLVDNAITEIRDLSKTQVTPLKQVNLQELIQSLVDKLNEATILKTNFVYSVNGQPIDDDLKLNIYRIVQEQLNNIVKHAGASKVNVLIDGDQKNLDVTITDDGKGFDTGKKRKGIGISNMINRVESFNGELIINSTPGNGCELKIRIPC